MTPADEIDDIDEDDVQARSTRVLAQPAFIKGGTMRDYQVEGLNWMLSLYARELNGILADEMGLGKTLQTISLLGHVTLEQKCAAPHLVVLPLSVLGNWQRELERWCPELKVVKLHGNRAERQATIKASCRAAPSSTWLSRRTRRWRRSRRRSRRCSGATS